MGGNTSKVYRIAGPSFLQDTMCACIGLARTIHIHHKIPYIYMVLANSTNVLLRFVES